MKKFFWGFVSAVLLVGIIAFNRTVESKVAGFPVPERAKYSGIDSPGEHVYSGSCFDTGLSITYQIALKIQGWNKVFDEGGKKIYEKDGKKVEVIYLTGEEQIYIYE